jgi:hypothetical protein
MGDDQRAAGAVGGGDIACVVCTLVRLAASCGRFLEHQPCVGSEGGANAVIAHW